MPGTPVDLIGRGRELDDVRAGLASGPVWVWGPPGIGKSALLDAVAAGWSGPVVRAAGATSPDAVIAAVRGALDLAPDASVPRAVAARPGALVVVDDADGLAGALADTAAALGAPALLAAGRSRGDPQEGRSVVVALGPLPTEAAAQLYRSAARRVAPGVRPDPAAVEALCLRLEGSPLAVLAAGSRVRTIPPDSPTLLAAISRSGPVASAVGQAVAALPETHRGALAAAAWFEGAFDGAAFEAVTGADASVLEELLDGALVGCDEAGRPRLASVLREWLRERATDPAGPADRHAAWVASEGRRRFTAWRHTGDPGPLEALRGDLERAARSGAPSACDAAIVLGELLLRRGPLRDPLAGLPIPADRAVPVAILRARLCRRTLQHEAALALLDAAPPTADPVLRVGVAMERAHHLSALGRHGEVEALLPVLRGPVPSAEYAAEAALAAAVWLQRRGRGDEAVAALREGAAVAETAGLPELRARIRAHLGAMARTSDPDGAARALVASLADYERLGDERWQGIVSQWLGVQTAEAGDLPRARDLLTRSLGHCARAGALVYEVQAHLYRCGVDVERGALDDARADLVAAERLGVMTPAAEATLRAHHGLVAHRSGDARGALEHYHRALAAWERLGVRGAIATWSAFACLAAAALGASPASDLARLEGAAGADAGDRLLATIVREALGEGISSATRAAVGAGRRSDLRLLLAIADGAAVRVARDGRTLTARDGTVVSLASRAVLVRILAALAAAGPGGARTRDELLAAGWPGQRLVGSSGQARLHVAVSTLRRFGAPISTVEVDGDLAYALDPTARVVDG
jgi:hypothetical protein